MSLPNIKLNMVEGADPPYGRGTRLIRVTPELMESWVAYYGGTVEWGEPDENGVYELVIKTYLTPIP